MLAAKYRVSSKAKRIETLQRLKNAVTVTNSRKRGVARPEGRINLDAIPDEAWRNQFR